MNLTPEIYAEICKQSAFISALIAGFSFAFIGNLLVSPIKKRVIDWVMISATLSIAGLILCSLTWTLIASRLALYKGIEISQVPQILLSLHKTLSFIFILSFFFFLVTLALAGWIRSRFLGIISGSIALGALIFFIVIMKHFVV
jgi:hypothetical protein